MSSIQIIQGDVRARLRELPESSISCCITSPPYFGLRSYSGAEQMWGGTEGCEHVWGDPEPTRRVRWGDEETLSDKQASNRGSEACVEEGAISTGRFCTLCNAWRGSLGNEPCPEDFVSHLVDVFREVRRVLHPTATVFLNLGDSYASSGGYANGGKDGTFWFDGDKRDGTRNRCRVAGISGLKPKDLIGIPWMAAFALRADGWYLRSDIIWSKVNPMPSSVEDRCTVSHEYLFMLTKSPTYFYDWYAVREPCVSGPSDIKKMVQQRQRIGGKTLTDEEPLHAANGSTNIGTKRGVGDPSGRNRRTVWTVPTSQFQGAHFATWPLALVRPCVLSGTSERGVCSKCGNPYVREIEVGEPDLENQRACGGDKDGQYHGTTMFPEAREKTGAPDPSSVKARILAGMRKKTTAGWNPTCKCNADVVPATVLDPFAGSGTTLLAASQLGRSGIGIELSEEYAEIAQKRLAPEIAQVKLDLEW